MGVSIWEVGAKSDKAEHAVAPYFHGSTWGILSRFRILISLNSPDLAIKKCGEGSGLSVTTARELFTLRWHDEDEWGHLSMLTGAGKPVFCRSVGTFLVYRYRHTGGSSHIATLHHLLQQELLKLGELRCPAGNRRSVWPGPQPSFASTTTATTAAFASPSAGTSTPALVNRIPVGEAAKHPCLATL
jgi:hypothetical protein